MKREFTVVELDRVVKFLDGLNKLAAVHQIGFSSNDDVYLVIDGKDTPYYLINPELDGMSVGVSV